MPPQNTRDEAALPCCNRVERTHNSGAEMKKELRRLGFGELVVGFKEQRRRQAALRRQCARGGRCVGCGIIRAGKESASAGNRSSRGSGTTILPQRQRERRWGENVCVARSATTWSPHKGSEG